MEGRFFIVGFDQETSQDMDSFLEYIKDQGFGWWHWIDNLWLLVTHNQQITTGEIRNELKKFTDRQTIIVLEVNPITWSTWGIETDKASVSEWLQRNWEES